MLNAIFVNGRETSTTLLPFSSKSFIVFSTSFFDSSEIPSSINSLITPIFAFLSVGILTVVSLIEVASKGSCPFIELYNIFASSTEFVIGPI